MELSGFIGRNWMNDQEWSAVAPPAPLSAVSSGLQGGRTLHEAAMEFESYFISYLMKAMRETVPQGGLLDRKGEQVWYSFYDQEIGRLAAQAGGIGLTSFIETHQPGK